MELDPVDNGHVVNRRFGLPPPSEEKVYEKISAMSGKKMLDSITLKLVMREQYETMYDICNHDNSSPLALVEMHKKERIVPYGRYNHLVNMFCLYEIREMTGLTLTEFFELTRVEVEHLLDLAAERSRIKAVKNSQTDAAIRNLNNRLGTG